MNLGESQLSVSNLHTLWYRVSGNTEGKKIILCNGGPGGESKDSHLEVYDLTKVCIIQFDQRGCGKSTPRGELTENSTDTIIQDIENLRRHLEIDTWFVAGSSWGSTLALLYAQAYPQRVKGLLLSSIFLARKQDLEWLETGVTQFFPELVDYRNDLLSQWGCAGQDWTTLANTWIQSDDEEYQRKSLALYSSWEGNFYQLESRMKQVHTEDVDLDQVSGSRIYHHYLSHRFFLSAYSILDKCQALEDIPTVMLHGRYDMICPPEQAYQLHKLLPSSRLEITNFDGHKFSAETRRLQRYLWNSLLL